MWGPAGHAYVYFVYGMHHCFNVVTVGDGTPEAVLIRGATPLAGGAVVRRRRGPKVAARRLLDGPAKLCQALAITRAENGLDLCSELADVSIRSAGSSIEEESVHRSPRVGVDYAGPAASWPLRLRIANPDRW